MKEPLYRWVCTMCGISDQAESPEMARLNIDLHVRLAGRWCRRRGSGPYRAAERFMPTLLGSRVGAFAVRL